MTDETSIIDRLRDLVKNADYGVPGDETMVQVAEDAIVEIERLQNHKEQHAPSRLDESVPPPVYLIDHEGGVWVVHRIGSGACVTTDANRERAIAESHRIYAAKSRPAVEAATAALRAELQIARDEVDFAVAQRDEYRGDAIRLRESVAALRAESSERLAGHERIWLQESELMLAERAALRAEVERLTADTAKVADDRDAARRGLAVAEAALHQVDDDDLPVYDEHQVRAAAARIYSHDEAMRLFPETAAGVLPTEGQTDAEIALLSVDCSAAAEQIAKHRAKRTGSASEIRRVQERNTDEDSDL